VTSFGSAEILKLKADLKATDEVPPNDSKGAGTLEATYDSSSKQLSYTADYSGLTGNATMAHFHGPADAGKNGPIVVPVQGSVASPIRERLRLPMPRPPSFWPESFTSMSTPRRTRVERFEVKSPNS
jgi:hypothetical protein